MAVLAGNKVVVLARSELELRIAEMCRAREADVIVINEVRLPENQTDPGATPLHRGLRIQLAFDRPEAVGLLTRLLEGADIVIDGVSMVAPTASAGMKGWLGDLMQPSTLRYILDGGPVDEARNPIPSVAQPSSADNLDCDSFSTVLDIVGHMASQGTKKTVVTRPDQYARIDAAPGRTDIQAWERLGLPSSQLRCLAAEGII